MSTLGAVERRLETLLGFIGPQENNPLGLGVCAGRAVLHKIIDLAELGIGHILVLPPVVVACFTKQQVSRVIVETADPVAIIFNTGMSRRESFFF